MNSKIKLKVNESDLWAKPTVHADLLLKDVHVFPELRDGVAGQVEAEGQFADLVRDEAGDGLDLHDIGVGGAHLHEEAVSLAVVLVGGVQVPLQLVEQAALELVPDEEVEVRRLVQVVAVRLHGTDFLKGY